MMYCSNCGSPVDNSTVFCSKCGSKVQHEENYNSDKNVDNKAISQNEVSKKRKILSPYVILIAVFVIISILIPLGLAFFSGLSKSEISEEESGSYSKEEVINEMVRTVKEDYNLPVELDSVTTMVDVTAQPNAIRYHYILSGVDTKQISNESIKSNLLGELCDNSETMTILNQGIDMQYLYSMEDNSQTYFVSVTQADCL
jgi:uncharacterized membrane protein YvbJ